jgi:polysaccharide chain length determinant protein (PEP-CTERM system associated)
MELNKPHDYIDMTMRRKWWIIIPFVLVMIGSVAVYRKLPKIYKATTLILVEPQKIPSDYVRPTVTQSTSDRLSTIGRQIFSRASFEQVITQLHLIRDPSNPLLMSQKIESLKEAINIDVHRRGRRNTITRSFEISFEDRDPVQAARIVNKIASLFVTENLKIREEQSRSTAQFLENELRETEKRLEQKQEAIRRFKEQYMGELYDQLGANLRTLEQYRQRLQTNNESFISAQQEKKRLESQIDQIKAGKSYEQTDEDMVTKDPLLRELNAKKRGLQELQTQYTDEHPDVIAAKISIEELESRIRERESIITGEPKKRAPWVDPRLARLNQELEKVIHRIEGLLREHADLTNKIELFEQRVENAPKREEQMSTLQRDHGLLQENYRKLLDKKIQANLAENLEERQKAEQFKILDPATPPTEPFKPDRRKVFGLAFALGLSLGGVLAFMRERFDRSFYEAQDVEQFLGFPVIATLPRIEARKGKGK